jgi:hypothetical protein
MKIIFLDIDGVLNSQILYESGTREERGAMLYRKAIEQINRIVDETGAKIVISSSWRHSGLEECNGKLLRFGLKEKAIDVTPSLYFAKNKYDYNYSVPRGCEIKAWMEMNKGILGDKISKVRYVILDDDSDMLYWQRENFFWCDSYTGITPNIAYKVIRFLNNIQ